MKIYLVIAMRWGDPEEHRYLVGGFDRELDAIGAAEAEEANRGDKYGCVVVGTILSVFSENDTDFNKMSTVKFVRSCYDGKPRFGLEITND